MHGGALRAERPFGIHGNPGQQQERGDRKCPVWESSLFHTAAQSCLTAVWRETVIVSEFLQVDQVSDCFIFTSVPAWVYLPLQKAALSVWMRETLDCSAICSLLCKSMCVFKCKLSFKRTLLVKLNRSPSSYLFPTPGTMANTVACTCLLVHRTHTHRFLVDFTWLLTIAQLNQKHPWP